MKKHLGGAFSGRRGMSFILGVFLFVVVAGVLDARLPWPKPRNNSR